MSQKASMPSALSSKGMDRSSPLSETLSLPSAEGADLSSADGCMGLNAISEFGQRDADVTLIIRNAARAQRRTLMGVLVRAKAQGELGSDADLDSMADFFESTLAGIRMAAKAGKSRQALRKIAAFAGRAYMDHTSEPLPSRGQAGKDRR